ncbi:MAG: hypothetical protein HRT71_14250 [Flavobacteriales bacterium]|nr:hypothetical protein [Flavobacteriales bacterium]
MTIQENLLKLNIKLKKLKELRKEMNQAFNLEKDKSFIYEDQIQRIENRIHQLNKEVESGKIHFDTSCYKQILNGIEREKNTINLLEHILLSHHELDNIEIYEIV